jgi:phosphate transport system substrate-binding protein
MDDAQLKEYRAKRGMAILHFPTLLGADVPTYNIPGVTAELKFTPEVLAGIFLGKITKWDDPQLTRTNPEAELPNHEIVVAFRSDGSGTTYIPTDYLAKVSEEWNKGIGFGTAVPWHGKESLTKSDGKLGGRQFTRNRRIRPFFGDVAQFG